MIKYFRPAVISLLSIILICLFFNGCSDSGSSTTAGTTIQRTVIPDAVPVGAEKIFPYELAKYQQNGYGKWHYGAGLLSEKRLDLMPTAYTGLSTTNDAQLLRFFTMSDIHIADKESPAEAVYLGYKVGTSSAYSGVMLYTTHVLDDAVKTINALHKKNQFDFGITLGDALNSAQYNELRWYIDVLDGKNINPDSGVKDDPIPGSGNDYQDEFKATGIDRTIPWYQAIGNHDIFWMGSFPLNDKVRQAAVGNTMMNNGNIFANNQGANSTGYYVGAVDGRTQYGNVIGAGSVADYPTPPTTPADPNRRVLTKKEWMGEFANSSSSPNGHGFSPSNIASGFASYSFEPKSNLPIKVIVLDDIQNENDPSDGNVGPNYGHGSLDAERYAWLINELDKGQVEDKLMIVATHVPIGSRPVGGLDAWSINPQVTAVAENDLVAKLHTYPNLLMWVAGHIHRNTVTAFKSPDKENHPELGFWEVETSSLRDFPQQFRTFDIVRNNDNTISIFTTNVDPDINEGSFAAQSRSYAIAAQQLFKNPLYLEPSCSYNAELVKKLTPTMQEKIKNYGRKLRK